MYPPEIDLVAIGERLQELRKMLNKTQRELCRDIGISPTTWNNWEKGKRLPDLIELIKLRKVYPISLDRIYFGGN